MSIKGHFKKCFKKYVLGQNKKFGGFGTKIGWGEEKNSKYLLYFFDVVCLTIESWV
jgi:hypothetical protein